MFIKRFDSKSTVLNSIGLRLETFDTWSLFNSPFSFPIQQSDMKFLLLLQGFFWDLNIVQKYSNVVTMSEKKSDISFLYLHILNSEYIVCRMLCTL